MGISKNKLYEEVLLTLGGGDLSDRANVQVELSEAQFNVVIAQAKRWFVARKGWVVWRPVQVVKNQFEYTMDKDIVKVLDVIFKVPTDVAAFFSLGFFDVIPYGPQNVGYIGYASTQYSTFAQLLAFNEERKRIFSVEPDWYWREQERILVIPQRVDTPSDIMLVQAKLNDFDISKVEYKDEDVLYRWIHAKSKQVVGRIRSKYDSLPAAGGQVTLDGQTLLQEAKEEFEILEKDIMSAQGPDVPVVG
jgi:hypothetical protein